jgi:hypothetical protein
LISSVDHIFISPKITFGETLPGGFQRNLTHHFLLWMKVTHETDYRLHKHLRLLLLREMP